MFQLPHLDLKSTSIKILTEMEKFMVQCKISGGKLNGYASEAIRKFIESNEGKNIEVVIKRKRAKRSDRQNRYYWGVVIPIVHGEFRNLGHNLNPEEVHFFLKQKFNYKMVCSPDGELIGEVPKSTAELNKHEFMEYIDKVIQWAAEILNITIPQPNEI